MFPFGSQYKPIVGLDIGSTAIKAVELRPSGKTWNLHRIGSVPLPPKAVSSGKIKDKEVVVQAIRDLWTQARFTSKRTAISVGGPAVIIKKIQLPLMTELDMEDQISLEAEEHIPFDIEEVFLDFQILNRGEETMEVLLTACKKELVNNRLEAPREAGLDPVLCDLDLFCVTNAFDTFCQTKKDKQPPPKIVKTKSPAPEKTDKTEKTNVTLLVNIGAVNLNIAILANGFPDFTRDHTFGGERMVQEIVQNQEISFEEAEQLLRQGKDAQNRPWPTESREQIVQPFLEQLGGLLKQSMDFYHASHANQQVSELFISGGCAILPETTVSLNAILNIPVQTVNPLTGLLGKSETAIPKGTFPWYMVAMGLALRGDA